MAIEVISKFIAGATVKVTAYIKDEDGDLVDPTSVKIIITDPDGTEIIPSEGNGDDDMTQYEIDEVPQTGIYEYFYNTTTASTKGWWRGEVVVVDGDGDDKTSIGTFGFEVI